MPNESLEKALIAHGAQALSTQAVDTLFEALRLWCALQDGQYLRKDAERWLSTTDARRLLEDLRLQYLWLVPESATEEDWWDAEAVPPGYECPRCGENTLDGIEILEDGEAYHCHTCQRRYTACA